MTEPRRLLASDSDASPLERTLLHAGRARREPYGMRGRVLAAVAAAGALAGGAKTAAAGESAAAKGAGFAAVTTGKIVVATALLATAGVAVYVATPSRAPVTRSASPVATAPTVTTKVVSAQATTADGPPIDAEAPSPTATPRPSRRVSAKSVATAVEAPPETRPSAPVVAVSALREEATLVEQARAALASGDVARAREHLADANARFPGGRLAEEREALHVRVVAAAGDPRRAALLARAFLARHPSSPLREAIEPLAKKVEFE